MEENFISKVIHAVIFIAVCTVLLSIGWDEPLRYRFMSSREIAEAEGGTVGEGGAAAGGPETWHPLGTALDRAPWEKRGGKIKYSTKWDGREMGIPTESDKRSGTTGKN